MFEQFRSIHQLRSRVLCAAAQSTVGDAFWAAQWNWGVEALYVFVDAMVRQSGDPASRIMAASPNHAVAEAMIAVLERAADDAAAHGHLKPGIRPKDLAAELYIVGQGLAQARRELGESRIDRLLAPEIFDVYVRDRLTSTGRRRLARQFVEAEFDLHPQSEAFRAFIARVWNRFLERVGGGP